MGFTIALIFET